MLDDYDPRLTAYALGELDEAERRTVEEELVTRPELREEVEAIRRGLLAYCKLDTLAKVKIVHFLRQLL